MQNLNKINFFIIHQFLEGKSLIENKRKSIMKQSKQSTRNVYSTNQIEWCLQEAGIVQSNRKKSLALIDCLLKNYKTIELKNCTY